MIGGDGINDESNKTAPAPIINFLLNNSDYLQKARKYGHFTGYKN